MPERTRLAGGGDQTGAGHPAHAGLHERIAHADASAERSVQGGVQRLRHGRRAQVRTSRVAQRARVEHDADELELLGSRQACLLDVVGDVQGKAGGGDDVVDGDARMVRAQPHGVVRRLEVEDPEVRDHAGDVVKAGGPRTRGGGPGVAHTADDVDLLHEGAHGVVGHPVAGGVVDRVTRRAAYADELDLGLVVRSDGRDVLVARAVDLARHHHHVAPARPHDVEDGAVGHSRLADQFGGPGAEGRRADHQRGFTVGEHDVGRKGELGQSGAQCGDGAERADHHFARLRATPRRRR